MDDMMLDALFKKGSKARQVAQLLLAGESHTRKELAESVGVSETTIPRVINALEGAGVEIESKTDKSRQVTYHLTGGLSWGALRGTAGELPEGVKGYYGLSWGEPTTVEVIDSEKTGGVFRANLDLSGMKATVDVVPVDGRSLPTAVIMGGAAKILGIMQFQDGRAGYRIADDAGAAMDAILVDLHDSPKSRLASQVPKKKAGARR